MIRMLNYQEDQAAESGGGEMSSTPTLFDVIIQLWPYLDSYDQLTVRQSCREGLRAHDCLLATLSVHDLWGRVLPGAPEEIADALRRAVKRGCCPRQLVLRLRGCSATVREARGLAVLRAFGPTSVVLPGQQTGCGGGGRPTGGGSGAACAGDSTSGSGCSIATCGSDISGRSRSSCSAGSDSKDGISSGDRTRTSTSAGGGVTALRMEGVPLTPRVLRTLAAASVRGPSRLKLYSYELSGDDGGGGGGSASTASTTAAIVGGGDTWGQSGSASPLKRNIDSPGQCRLRAGVPPPQRRCAAVRAAESRSSDEPTHGSPDARGAAALLHLLAPQLQELTLQDCSINASIDTGASVLPNLGVVGGGGSLVLGSVGDDHGSGGGGVAAAGRRADTSGGGDGTVCCICGGGSLPAAGAPVLDALRSCTALRHLGLRHTDTAGCPMLQLLLHPDVCRCGGGGGSGAGSVAGGAAPAVVGQVAAAIHAEPHAAASVRSAGGDAQGNECGDGGGGDGGDNAAPGVRAPPAPATPPAPAPSVLSSLSQLASLKIQTPLPAPGGVGALAAALAPLSGLTRLELGERTAVPSVAALLLPPPPPPLLQSPTTTSSSPPLVLLRNLRELSLVSAQLTSAAELAALAALRELTRVSLGGLCLPSIEMEPGVGLTAAAAAEAGERAGVSPPPPLPPPLPLPPLLRELSVAAPLPPATLLALRRPSTLLTLRITGFTLGMCDVDVEEVAAGDDGSAPLAMTVASQRQLTEAIRLLHGGTFAYRDLGIELHIGFHGPAAGRRRYLAAPAGAAADADRPVGHWAWASRLVPLALQGLELAGLELQEGDVSAIAGQLRTLEDLRLDCRYPLHAVAHLAALRRLRRLLLNASFWQSQPQPQGEGEGPPSPHPPVQQQQGKGPGEEQGRQPQPGPLGLRAGRSDAHVAAAALMSLCGAAPECLYDVALASYGRATARFCAMQALVRVETELPRVGCGALRVWVCP